MTHRTMLLSLVVAGTGLPACSEPAPEPVTLQPVASVTELMQAMVVPASNSLFDAARNPPKGTPGWNAARNSAVILAESGNLLLIGSRAEDSEVWTATARAMAAAGADALAAARSQDAEAFGPIGDRIIEACEQCHEKHWIR